MIIGLGTVLAAVGAGVIANRISNRRRKKREESTFPVDSVVKYVSYSTLDKKSVEATCIGRVIARDMKSGRLKLKFIDATNFVYSNTNTNNNTKLKAKYYDTFKEYFPMWVDMDRCVEIEMDIDRINNSLDVEDWMHINVKVTRPETAEKIEKIIDEIIPD